MKRAFQKSIIRVFLRWMRANGYYIRRRSGHSIFSEAVDEKELLKAYFRENE